MSHGDETAPFFGFLGAAAALVFSCKQVLYLCDYCLLINDRIREWIEGLVDVGLGFSSNACNFFFQVWELRTELQRVG